MGKITIRETSQVGESRSEVEYIFEDSSDYFAWSEQKTEALNSALKNYVDQPRWDFLDELNPKEPAEPMTGEIKVGLKTKKETKH